VKSTETIELSDEDLVDAITMWLGRKRIQERTVWKVSLGVREVSHHPSEIDRHFVPRITATRELP